MKYFIVSLLMIHAAYGMTPKYMPVVLMPGISSDMQAAEPFKEKLRARFPQIYVKIIAPLEVGLHDGWQRIEHVRKQIKKDPILMSSDHYNMVCHSQGTLDGRGIIETRKDDVGNDKEPQVYNYIGLSGPQAGEFGTPHTLLQQIETFLHCSNEETRELINSFLKAEEKDIYKILYTPLAQKNISFAGYWHDPFHEKAYLEKNRFLPLLNNEQMHENAQQYKRNILSLNTMILISSLLEQEIKPRLSSLFYFYKSGSDKIVQTFDERYNAAHDPLGLWTLQCQNRLKFLQANCLHTKFWSDQQVFDMVAQYAGISLEDDTANTTFVRRRGCVLV